MLSILDLSQAGAIMILVILAIRATCINRLPKRTFQALWGLALLRLLVPVAIPSRFSAQTMGLWLRDRLAARPEPMTAATPALPAPLPSQPEALPVETAIGQGEAFPWFLWLWLAGVCLLAAYFLITYVRSRRLFATSLPVEIPFVTQWLAANPTRRRVQTRQTDRPYGPLTYGLLRPVILLPQRALRLPEGALAYVLAHELTHVRRGDALFKLLLIAALCLHWFNPLAWALFFLANRDLELACDEAVVRAFGEANKAAYARTLIDMAERRSRTSPLLSSFSKYAIEERITAIMKIKKHTRLTTLVSFALVFALALCLGTTALASGIAAPTTPALPAGLTAVAHNDGSVALTEVEWYTYEEYKAWLDAEKAALQALVGAGAKGWTATSGVFEWTQERVDETIALYEGILADIGNGLLVSKPDALEDATFQATPADEQTISFHSTDTASMAGQTVLASQMAPAPAVAKGRIIVSSDVHGRSDSFFEVEDALETTPAAGVVTRGFTMSVALDDRTTVQFGPYESEAALNAAVEAYLNAMVQAGLMARQDAQALLDGLR